MKQFLSCDWGTSAFRLRLVTLPSDHIVAEVQSDWGIKRMFNEWRTSGAERLHFFREFIQQQVGALQSETGCDLSEVAVVLSGMACSSIGMMELPYTSLPFLVEGSSLTCHILVKDNSYAHPILLLSGLRFGDEVMRGEETALLGAADASSTGLFIFPGTHSKHVEVSRGEVQHFSTYLTGEVFELVSKHSVLSASVTANDEWQEEHQRRFAEGVRVGVEKNLLNSLFSVRTNELFAKCGKHENFHYLSGLVIGAELKDVSSSGNKITVLGNRHLRSLYRVALETLVPGRELAIVDMDAAVVRGQAKMVLRHSL